MQQSNGRWQGRSDLVSLALQLISLSKKLKVAHGGSVYPLESENDDSNQMRNLRECLEKLLAETRQTWDSGELPGHRFVECSFEYYS